MKAKTRFLISSLFFAGFVSPREILAALPATNDPDDGNSPLFNMLNGDQPVLTSAHSSHSSHSSHASHASGSGGGYVVPPYSPPPAPRIAAPAPVIASPNFTQVVPSPPASQPSVEPANELVILVQNALLALGFYHGELTGIVDGPTQTAIMTFQTQWSLQRTGTVTPELINSLRIGG